MSDLRTRIAAVLAGTCCSLKPPCTECVEAELPSADAVIAELNLHQEESFGTTYPNVPVEDRRLTRWVTDWTANE